MDYRKLMEFYKGKRVLVTGHTGFKGSWMCRVLLLAGAEVCGYALEPPTEPSLFELAGLEGDGKIKSFIGDIRDYGKLKEVFDEFKPEVVIHLAAQPIVRESYKNPRYTFETNVMGTVNVCECVRLSKSAGADGYDGVRSFVNVTTDKVYDNKERSEGGYREEEPLDGYDPYSNSKSCSELVTHSYVRSFLADSGIAVSTARAGNVIGGGDFAVDRIIPDCVRAALEKREIVVRNQYSVRPYQHVLEPVFVYLMIAMEQYVNRELSGWYNVGPDDTDCVTTGELVNIFTDCWKGTKWQVKGDGGPHEAGFLKLNCDKLKDTFSWKPVWNIRTAVQKTVEFSMLLDSTLLEGMHCGSRKIADETEALTGTEQETEALSGNNFSECMDRQIMEYIADARKA